jgi:type 1 fimbria pilin
MPNIQTHSWAGPWPKILRCLVWVFLFAAFMTVNESHAQKCANRTVLVKQTLPTIMPFSFSSGTKVLGSFEATLTLDNCSGYSPARALKIRMAMSRAIQGAGNDAVSGRQYTVTNDAISCFVNNMCVDSENQVVRDIFTSPASSGIKFGFEAQINGTDNASQECVAGLRRRPEDDGELSGLPGIWFSRRVDLNFGNTNCSKITINVKGRITQTAGFYKPNVQTIRLGTDNGDSTNFRFVILADSLINEIGFNELASSPASLTSQGGTCALSLSPTFVDMGNFTLDQVKAIAQGNAVATKTLSIIIRNCTGFAAGLNKVLQWNFAKPSVDLTQMTNMAVSGASQGLSAEILADQKFTLVAIPVDMGTNKIKSGESYITSGKTSDNQTLNYTVRLVRNSETVTNGGFSSTATVTLSYQ